MSLLGITLTQQGRMAEGEQVCRQAVAMNNKVPVLHFRLGWVQNQQGRYREARASYEAALGLDPAFGLAQQALGLRWRCCYDDPTNASQPAKSHS